MKGIVPLVFYAAAIPLAFVHPAISGLLYVAVAVMWFVPDRRIEARIKTKHEQARLLRSPGRCPQCLGRRPEEGLSPQRDEAPSGPQSGRQAWRWKRSRSARKPTKCCRIRPSAACTTQHGHAAFEHGMGGGRGPGAGFGDMGDIFGDIFGNIFGGGGAGPRCATRRRHRLRDGTRSRGSRRRHREADRDPDARRLCAPARAPARRTARSTPARPAMAAARCACSAASSPCSSRVRIAAGVARPSPIRARPAMATAGSRKRKSCR